MTTQAQEKETMVLIKTSKGDIKVKLYNDTPLHRDNFIKLINEGWYNNSPFHRVINNFMIQGGDPKGNGTGGPGYSIRGEFSKNGFPNNLKHVRGVISMARSRDYNSATCQFFIMLDDNSQLDGEYAAFGEITEGMDVIDAVMASIKTVGSNGEISPKDQPIIEKIEMVE